MEVLVHLSLALGYDLVITGCMNNYYVHVFNFV